MVDTELEEHCWGLGGTLGEELGPLSNFETITNNYTEKKKKVPGVITSIVGD